jgi:tetratricopeptide (TPR) repeat protein
MAEVEHSEKQGSGKGQGGEDLDFEIGFYERILKRLPDSLDVLMALGNDYTERGLHEKGVKVDERLCDLRPTDPVVHYNLACSYSLVGQVDQAIAMLEHAVTLGYHDCAYLQRDPDLDTIRRDPRYQALVERVTREQMTA